MIGNTYPPPPHPIPVAEMSTSVGRLTCYIVGNTSPPPPNRIPVADMLTSVDRRTQPHPRLHVYDIEFCKIDNPRI